MKANQYLDLIKLCASVVLLTLASLIVWTGIGTFAATTLDPLPVGSSPASKRGRILREASPDKLNPIDSYFLDYEIGGMRASSASNDMT